MIPHESTYIHTLRTLPPVPSINYIHTLRTLPPVPSMTKCGALHMTRWQTYLSKYTRCHTQAKDQQTAGVWANLYLNN